MTKRSNYFVEGLQGAGKSTFVRMFSDQRKDYTVFREGDYSPIDLAWCAYVTEEAYDGILESYPSLVEEIKSKTVMEGSQRIICYTQILTDIPGFHQNLEKFEIYNANLDRESFENVVCERFLKWKGEGQIFECAFFQNIIENQMLYFMMSEEEILSFYRRLGRILADKPYKIIYLDVEDTGAGIEIIRKERADDKGNELWLPIMLRYLEESPCGKAHNLTGIEGLVAHLEERKALEHRIMQEVFKENAVILKAKDYEMTDVLKRL